MSQNFSFPDTNAHWSYIHVFFYEFNPPVIDYYTTHFALFNNDTVIDDTIYSKLYLTSDSIFPEDLSNVGYKLIKTEGDKVYYYDNNNTLDEFLIYDFGLNVGDSMDVTFKSGHESFLVCEGIDSVLIDEIYRKRWYITCPETDFYNYWVEGIGSDYHLLSSLTPYFSVDPEFWELLCFKQDGSLIYEGNNLVYEGGCHAEGYFNPDKMEERSIDKQKVNIVPNPIGNISKLKIDNLENEVAEIYIYNCNGNFIRTYKGSISDISIQKENYNKGIYFAKVIIEEKVYTTKFIIK